MAVSAASSDYSPELFPVDSEDEHSLLCTSPKKRPRLSVHESCSIASSGNSPMYLSDSDTNASTDSDGAPVYLSDDDSIAQSGDSVPSHRGSDSIFGVTGSPLSSKAMSPAPPRNTEHCHDDESCLGLNKSPLPSKDGDLDEVSHILVSACCSAQDVLSIRRKMKSLKLNAKRQWLMDKILENDRAIEPGKVDTKFPVAGREVCLVHSSCTEVVQEGSRRYDAVEPLRSRVQVSYTPLHANLAR